jgi:hypothetical protein
MSLKSKPCSKQRECARAGIRPSFNIIFGFPGEVKPNGELYASSNNAELSFKFWTNISPCRRTHYAASCRTRYDVPQTFEGWADFFPRHTSPLSRQEHRRVQIMREFLRIAFERIPIAADRRNVFVKGVHHAMSIPARFRLDLGFYGFPVEIWIKRGLGRLTAVAKPKVDAQILESKRPAAKERVLRTKTVVNST